MYIGKKIFGLEKAANIDSVVARNDSVLEFFASGLVTAAVSLSTYELNIIEPVIGGPLTYGFAAASAVIGGNVVRQYLRVMEFEGAQRNNFTIENN